MFGVLVISFREGLKDGLYESNSAVIAGGKTANDSAVANPVSHLIEKQVHAARTFFNSPLTSATRLGPSIGSAIIVL